MSAVVIDGGLVHYEAFGRGEPVLFLHGWLGSWRYWMRTMEAISDKNRTYALDLWGFGDSDKSKSRYEIKDYITLIDEFVNDMGIRDAPIIGHALGATVALEYALLRPGRVKKIMAVSLPFGADSISRKLLDFTDSSVVSKMKWWRQRIEHAEVESELEKSSRDAISISMEAVAAFDITSRIQSINQSDTMLLAVYGEKDDIVDLNSAKSIAENGQYTSQNIRRIILPECKHFPMLDEAAKFNRLLKDFLDTGDDLYGLELKEEWRRRHR